MATVHINWTQIEDLRGEGQYRAEFEGLVARTLVTIDGMHRCMVLDPDQFEPIMLHDAYHGTAEGARQDAEDFLRAWVRLGN